MYYKRLMVLLFIMIYATPTAVAKEPLHITVIVSEDASMELLDGFVHELAAYGQVESTIMPTKEQIKSSDVIAFISNEELVLDAKIWAEINASKAIKIVVGDIIPQLTQMTDWQRAGEVEVYKLAGKTLDQPFLTRQLTAPQSEVIASASSYSKEVPAVIQKEGFLYLAPVALQQKTHLVAKQAIQKILDHQNVIAQSSLLLITNVDYNTNVERLQKIIDALRQENIPITLQIKTTIKDNKNNRIFKLRDNKPLVKLLRQVQQDGAKFVMKNERLGSVQMDFEEITIDGLYPIGSNYQYEGIPLRIQNTVNTYLPTKSGAIIEYVPIVLRYNVENITVAKEVVAAELRPYTGLNTVGVILQYPAYGKVSELKEYIASLDTIAQYEWLDLQKLPLRIDNENVTVIQGESVEIIQHTPKWRMFVKRYQDNPAELLLWGMALFVLAFVVLFFINTLFMRLTLRKRLFKERSNHG